MELAEAGEGAARANAMASASAAASRARAPGAVVQFRGFARFIFIGQVTHSRASGHQDIGSSVAGNAVGAEHEADIADLPDEPAEALIGVAVEHAAGDDEDPLGVPD